MRRFLVPYALKRTKRYSARRTGRQGGAVIESVMEKELKSRFVSILDPAENPDKERPRHIFFTDLNLDQIIDRICRDWGENVEKYYSRFPADASCEDYRRKVFGDVKQTEVYKALCEFVERMKARREVFVKKGEVEHKLQRAAWHIREVDDYCGAFTELYKALEGIQLFSEGLKEFRTYLGQYLATEEFRKMRQSAAGLLEELNTFRLVLTYENDRITLTEGEIQGAYDAFLEGCFPGQSKRMKSPFETTPGLLELEKELLQVFRKKNPGFFQRAEAFFQKYDYYAREELLRFASEIRFYLSYCCFERKMQERGFEFCVPVMAERPRGGQEAAAQENAGEGSHGREAAAQEKAGEGSHGQEASGRGMSASGLYDLALACANRAGEKEIVSNDMEYRINEGFFVLTGPNQGGKTTFARSLGQLIYLAKMGLDVPARRARLYRFPGLLTHFSVEESVETGRGKLMDELERLANMMTDSCAGSFVVINELFTTAANYDACIMGKRVLEHFLAQGCMGIYVTHLAELAEAHPQVVSLKAMLDEKGMRSFRIERGRAADYANAASQVRQYGLTYEQLKERLPGRQHI